MKYIRTEDGIIPDSWEYLPKLSKTDYHKYFNNMLKSAETIEELFDEFRGIWINYYEEEGKDAHEEYYYDKEKNVFYDDFEELTPKEAIEKFDIFYGAIWTDQGLIYKAKMKGILPNGKIDWELL